MQDIKNDFNPFDLSAPPKPKIIPLEAPEDTRAKPTVKKVSMGPLFHSRITKTIALILSIILAGLVGYTGANYYLTKQAEQAINTNVIK